MIRTLKRLFVGDSSARQPRVRTITERDLIEREALIGKTIFGEIKPGHDRDFFCLDDRTWIWREQWIDEAGQKREILVRYEIQSRGILKVLPGGNYQFVDGKELDTLHRSVRIYHQRVMQDVYGRDPLTGNLMSAA